MARRALSDLFGPVEVVDSGLGVLRPASGASCWVYATGTTTPVTVYADASSSTTLTLPVTTNSQGEPPGYVATDQDIDLVSVYKGNTTTSTATSLTAADVAGGGGGGGATSLTSTATPSGANQIPQSTGSGSRAVSWTTAITAGQLPSSAITGSGTPLSGQFPMFTGSGNATSPGSAAVLNSDGTITNLSALTGLNVKNYGATGNGSTDDTAAVVAAQTAARSAGRPLYFPKGTYKLTSGFTIQAKEVWVGDGWSAGSGGTVLSFQFASGGDCFTAGSTSGFTDTAQFRDFYLQGDSTNTQRGWFCQSTRYFRWERLWVTGLVRENVYIYGQRNGNGLISAGFPGDATHNVIRDCTFVSADTTNTYDVIRLGGTSTACPTTITADGGTTITVADGTQVQGATGTIVCADNGEQINFTGKSTNTLTGLTRGVNGTTQITHPNGTTFYVKRSMGAANMNSLAQVVVTANGGFRGRYGVFIESGANNTLIQSTAVTQMGADGVAIGWYSNVLEGCVVENNTNHGVHFLGNYDAHGNWMFGQDSGGLNGLSDFQDDTDGNGWIASDGTFKIPNEYVVSPTTNAALYRSTLSGASSRLHWRDASGTVNDLAYTTDVAPPRQQQMQNFRGITTETYPQFVAGTNITPVAAATPTGTLYLGGVWLYAGDVITNVIVSVSTVGAGTAPNLIKLGLFGPLTAANSTGVFLAATANLASDSRWTAGTAPKVCALSSPVTISTAGAYFLGFLQSGTWGTTQMQLSGANTATTPMGIIGSNGRGYAMVTLQTDITANVTYASPTGGPIWFACS